MKKSLKISTGKHISFFLLLIFFSFLIKSQSITIPVGSAGDDKIRDIISSNNNYLLAPDLPNPFKIEDSVYNLSCYPTLSMLDNKMNLHNYICFTDGSGTVPRSVNQGSNAIIDMDPNSHHLFFTGKFPPDIVIGSDTLTPPGSPDGILLSKLDTNLKPIWAIANTYHEDWFSHPLEVREMEVDGQGRVWLSVEMDYLNSIAFENDTVYGQGIVVFDTSGSPVPAYFNMPGVSDYIYPHIKRVDRKRVLLVKEDGSVQFPDLQMMDTDADTLLWSIPYVDRIDEVSIDTTNQYIYALLANNSISKIDYSGNTLWRTYNASHSTIKKIDFYNRAGNLYVAAKAPGNINKLYVMDSLGSLVDSTIWGLNTNGNSAGITLNSFQIDDDKLKMVYSAYQLDTSYFGLDTIYGLGNLDIVLSFIDLGQMLTDVPNYVIKENSLMLYPNPAKQRIGFSLTAEKEAVQIELLDIQGRVFETKIEQNANSYSLDISHLKAGIYFLKIQTGKEIRVGKFMKQ